MEQINYLTKGVNVYIVCDVDNCLFGATTIVKNGNKEKWLYSDFGIGFNETGESSFGNDSARNVVIFGVDNCSSSHTDNCKNNCLILGEGPTFGINGSFGLPEKEFSNNFCKAKTKFCLGLHYNDDNSYLIENKSLGLKPIMETSTFQLGFVYKVYLMDFMLLSLEEYLLEEIPTIFQSITMLLISMTF